MPGVSQPDYVQSGGSNNPTRAMAITINGQPPNNTVVRLDGVTQINQFFQQIQAYSPSLEAIETVSVVTNSFDADQGMAGAAAVNVQVKSGTNKLSGSLFEQATDYRMKARNFFLPPGETKGTGNHQASEGRLGARSSVTSFSSSPAWKTTGNGRRQGTHFRIPAPTVWSVFRQWPCARAISPAPVRSFTTR